MDSWYKIYIPFIFLISSAGISWAGIYFLLHSPIVNFFKDRPEPRKLHIQPIPRLGGIAIITTFLLFIAGISIFNKPSNLFSDISTATLTIFIASSIVILIFGFLDDTSFVTIRVRHKIFAEVAIAFSAVYIFHLNIGTLSIFNSFSLPPSVSNIVSFLWIIGIINAYNLIDGLDGLAGSISLIGIAFLAVLAGIGEQSSIILICCILSGTVIGFLIHNTEPAKTFMGDTGSLFLGTVIALLTLYIGRDVTPQRAFIVMPLIAGLPIIEVFITMVRRYFRSKDRKDKHAERIHSMVIPDNSHIHHRFIYRGYSPFQSTIILSLLSFILGCGAICCALAPSIFIPFILVYLSIPIIIALYRLGFGGRFKKALRISETRYNGYKKSSLIGVIDRDGSISQLLEKQKSPIVDYNFVPINEDQVPTYLHTAIVYDTFTPESKLEEKAEKISTLLSRPVFIIKKNGSSNYFNIQQISRNGSLSVLRKTVSIRELARDLEKVSRSDKIKHPPSTPTPTVLFPPEPFSSQENEYEPELAYAES